MANLAPFAGLATPPQAVGWSNPAIPWSKVTCAVGHVVRIADLPLRSGNGRTGPFARPQAAPRLQSAPPHGHPNLLATTPSALHASTGGGQLRRAAAWAADRSTRPRTSLGPPRAAAPSANLNPTP